MRKFSRKYLNARRKYKAFPYHDTLRVSFSCAIFRPRFASKIPARDSRKMDSSYFHIRCKVRGAVASESSAYLYDLRLTNLSVESREALGALDNRLRGFR